MDLASDINPTRPLRRDEEGPICRRNQAVSHDRAWKIPSNMNDNKNTTAYTPVAKVELNSRIIVRIQLNLLGIILRRIIKIWILIFFTTPSINLRFSLGI